LAAKFAAFKLDHHLSGIKKLAGQTAIYGVTTVLGRFLNVFLTFWLTYEFGAEKFAIFSLIIHFQAQYGDFTLDQARVQCQQKKAELASITSEAEDYFVRGDNLMAYK